VTGSTTVAQRSSISDRLGVTSSSTRLAFESGTVASPDGPGEASLVSSRERYSV
jgi:hypothetical protein